MTREQMYRETRNHCAVMEGAYWQDHVVADAYGFWVRNGKPVNVTVFRDVDGAFVIARRTLEGMKRLWKEQKAVKYAVAPVQRSAPVQVAGIRASILSGRAQSLTRRR